MMGEGQLIEHDGRIVGVAVRVHDGFMFFSSEPYLRSLEATVFSRAELITLRVAELLGATRASSGRCAIATPSWNADTIDVCSGNVVQLRPKQSHTIANPEPPDAA
jgi:hypothetical protein